MLDGAGLRLGPDRSAAPALVPTASGPANSATEKNHRRRSCQMSACDPTTCRSTATTYTQTSMECTRPNAYTERCSIRPVKASTPSLQSYHDELGTGNTHHRFQSESPPPRPPNSHSTAPCALRPPPGRRLASAALLRRFRGDLRSRTHSPRGLRRCRAAERGSGRSCCRLRSPCGPCWARRRVGALECESRRQQEAQDV